MRGSPQCQEESTVWLYREAPGILPSRLYLHYSVFQVAFRLYERHIKELLLTTHSMALMSKQIHEPSKPKKQTPNPGLLLDTARPHTGTACPSVWWQLFPHCLRHQPAAFLCPSIFSSTSWSSHTQDFSSCVEAAESAKQILNRRQLQLWLFQIFCPH